MILKAMLDEFSDFGLKTTMLHVVAKIAGDYNVYKKRREFQIDTMTSEELKSACVHWFKTCTGRDCDFENPRTFDEKIQWLKIYDSTPLKTKCADKLLVREYVKQKIGGQYLVPLLGAWNSFDEIDFEELPQKFVLKTNHACATNMIVKDKSLFDVNAGRTQFEKWLAGSTQVYQFFELHYRDIPRKIIAEEYIEQADGNLLDYKIHCFRGVNGNRGGVNSFR